MTSRNSRGACRDASAFLVAACLASAPALAAQRSDPNTAEATAGREPSGGGRLTLDTAIKRTIAASPEAAANAARLDALTAARTQAGVRLNPSVELFGENFAGTGSYNLLNRTEITASYAQTIERGRKRELRVRLAESEIGIAEAEAIVQRLDIVQRVQAAYVEAITAEAMIKVVTERVDLAKSLQREVKRRVDEARDPLFAGTRAATRVAEAQVDLELAVHARDAALTRLAALWGGSATGLSVSTEEFYRLDHAVASSGSTAAADLAVSEARVRRAEAAIAVEQSRRIQDPTVRGGLRYFNDSKNLAFVGGVSIPLARFDTNRAGVARATAEARRAEAEIEVARVTRLRELRLAQEKVEEARHEAEAIMERVLPGAQKTLAQVREGFARGGFRHVDIDDAQTALTLVHARLVRATAEYHEARVQLDRLTGRFAGPLPQEDIR